MIILIISTFSCREQGGEGSENVTNRDEPDEKEAGQIEELTSFSSEEWGVRFEYPKDFEVHQGELAPNSPVINIYPSSAGVTPPLGIHEQAEDTYIAIIPNGYGVDGPGGKRVSIREWEGGSPVTFNIDRENSTVYLLENNQPWGFLLKFREAPEKWREQGNIFVRIGVNDFNAVCEGKEQGMEIEMANCDPLAGDVVKYYGEINKEEREAVNTILRSLQFFTGDREMEPLEDLIQVEVPTQNSKVSSPLEIKGRAKGYWFFEAVASVKLVDEDHNLLGRGSITATKEWMTEDFVPFESSLEFEEPSTGKGYLILNRANASGKPEHDRALHIPVKF